MKNEILDFIEKNQPIPSIDVIRHISPKYPRMVNRFINSLINDELIFVNSDNYLVLEKDKRNEAMAIRHIIAYDRCSMYVIINNAKNSYRRLIKKFSHNKIIINVSKDNWTLNPDKWKEIFHDILGFDIEKSRILGKRLSEYKIVYSQDNYGKFIFSD